MELCRQVKTSDSSTRASWQLYQQSYLVAKQEQLMKKMMSPPLTNYLFQTCRVLQLSVKFYDMGRRIYVLSEGRRAADLFCRPRQCLNPQSLGLVASTLTSRSTRAIRILSYTVSNCGSWECGS
jgi:hypothetical protein